MLTLIALGLAPAASAAADDLDYLRDVKPILARHCVACHGAERPRAGLRLDTAAAALRGGDSGPAVVPGDPDSSELLLAVLGEGAGERMPLKRPPLSDTEIGILRRWIAAGAPAPADDVPSEGPPVHWAFLAPSRPPIPAVVHSERIRNPIDAFIESALERDGLTPNDEADRSTLIRRVSLDLIGLPPSLGETVAFLADERPDAYERLVDRLLASPHYGERWARWWLDMARYADSHGYSIDAPREMWPYRDWVLDALNHDMPFDVFTIDQIAGDLRPDATLAQRVATGFHRNTPINMEGGIDKEQFRVESVLDRVNTTGSVWLGLTIGCAQCHDHKYDPLTMRDYYGLFAFLNNVDEPEMPVASAEAVARKDEIRREIADYLASIADDPTLRELQSAWETGMTPAQRQAQTEEVRKALDVALDRREPAANRPAFAAFIDQAKRPELAPHQARIAALRKQEPRFPTTLVVAERAQRRESRFLLGGDFTRPGDPIDPGVPSILPSLEVASGKPLPDRMDLAHWLVDRRNPLTARVLVNRVWQAHFGRGLVETDSDFGTQGAPPTHPDLLDWLAVETMDHGWSLKALQRLIVTSAAYRRSSVARPDLLARDPDNRTLARQSRLRLDAELVRDAALVASGRLTRTLGGPSVFPPQPEGVMGLGQIKREWRADAGPDRDRRGLYTYLWRATPHPLLTVFDAPDPARACTRRPRSNTPLQALLLLNDEAFVECARSLAARSAVEAPADDVARLVHLFRLTLNRDPAGAERDRLLALLAAERDRGDDADAWTAVARVLLNLDEFITRE
jgi:mono/diheme cytochrome c family protein